MGPLATLIPRTSLEKNRSLRIALACVLVTIPMGVAILYADRESMFIESMGWWSIWCIVAWMAMQGPGRWRSALISLGYAAVVAAIGVWMWRTFQPFLAGPWSTLIDIDLPATLFVIVKAWAILRIMSMVLGLEIDNPVFPMPPRWSLRRWFMLMICLAILLQTMVSEMNWFGEMAKGFAGDSSVGPVAVPPLTQARQVWVLYNAAAMLTVPFVPILLAAWMLAGSRWRWALFPVLGALVMGSNALAQIAIRAAQSQASWLPKLQAGGPMDWAMIGFVQWLAYGFAAILVPWMGYRWIDYWSPKTVLRHPTSTTETLDS